MRPLTLTLALALSGLLIASCADSDPVAEGPLPARNLLLISLDTTRVDRLGCYGYEGGTTPELDALASEGVRFTSAWTPMTITLPAHSALMTSRHPRGLGVTNNLDALPEQESTLAERLKAAGFATGGFVSAPVLHKECGLSQGFDRYEAPRRGTVIAEKIYQSARTWLAAHKHERFFCFVHHYDPHAEYEPPEPFRSRFGVTTPVEEHLPPWETMAFMQQPELLTPQVIDQSTRAYDAELAYTDHQVGLLIEDLRIAGLLEETVVIVVADHGETFAELAGEYGYAFDHGEFLHPREAHVPFLMHGPERLGLRGGVTFDQPVVLTDVMPTALDLLGLECVAPFEGRSLEPLLRGGALEPTPIVTQRHRFQGKLPHPSMAGEERSVLYGQWFMVESEGRGRELYDLGADPGAERNLATTEAERAAGLAVYLEHWLEDHPAGALAVPAEISAERRKALDELGYAGGG